MQPVARIDTARLWMRPWTDGDVDALHQLWLDPDVRKYLWDDRVVTRQEAEHMVRDCIASVPTHGFGMWAIMMQGADTLIGFAGFRPFGDSEAELMYGLAPHHWGHGLGAEAVHATLQHGFTVHRFRRVTGITDVPNVASARLMERVGMTFDKRAMHHGLDCVFYTAAPTTFSAHQF